MHIVDYFLRHPVFIMIVQNSRLVLPPQSIYGQTPVILSVIGSEKLEPLPTASVLIFEIIRHQSEPLWSVPRSA